MIPRIGRGRQQITVIIKTDPDRNLSRHFIENIHQRGNVGSLLVGEFPVSVHIEQSNQSIFNRLTLKGNRIILRILAYSNVLYGRAATQGNCARTVCSGIRSCNGKHQPEIGGLTRFQIKPIGIRRSVHLLVGHHVQCKGSTFKTEGVFGFCHSNGILSHLEDADILRESAFRIRE